MSQQEINDVVASVEALVRRAYTLGRRDGLRHLVKFAESDEAIAKPLALLAPAAEAAAMKDGGYPAGANDAGPPVADENMAPKSRYNIPERGPGTQGGGLGSMILDFVYPPKAS
jgi:hypothetical protein